MGRSWRPFSTHDRAGRRPSAACTEKPRRLELRSRRTAELLTGGKWQIAPADTEPCGPRFDEATFGGRRAG
ncbi:hypothetical protein NDU88_002709 [Pleurodeles waltl]|uniref:Uncharacterized protein n=1 Tax=Pleurodeles waltl TaxID=8319 RepID=A0AAV7WPC5_PLEWA|nr:hypothetical protein NDU88_002709 [Pleurodeles waltl]